MNHPLKNLSLKKRLQKPPLQKASFPHSNRSLTVIVTSSARVLNPKRLAEVLPIFVYLADRAVHAFLFDVFLSEDAFVQNARRAGVRLQLRQLDIALAVLRHSKVELLRQREIVFVVLDEGEPGAQFVFALQMIFSAFAIPDSVENIPREARLILLVFFVARDTMFTK